MTSLTRNNPTFAAAIRTCIVIACTGILAAGCAVQTTGGMSGGGSTGGMSGGSSGGGMSGGGSSGGDTSGGSSGGGSEGGMSGGSSGGSSGGMSGGSSGGMSGGTSGGMSGGSMGGGSSGGSVGGMEGMEGVSIPGGSGGAGSNECDDGGVTGGGIGGGMDCEQGDNGAAGGVGEYPGGDPEAAERLGKELDESLGDFDESLGEEQREIASTSRNTEGFDTGSGGNRGGSISLGEQSAGAMSGGSGGGGGSAGEDAPGAVGKAGALEGMDSQEIARRTPDDIEAIIDDDVVAKQLREAALAEEDPELRERLWEEYRKYKGM